MVAHSQGDGLRRLPSDVKILALVTDAYGGHGGIAQYNRDFCRALSRASYVHEVVVLPRWGKGNRNALPERIRQLAPTNSRVLYSAKALMAAAQRRPFDLIFCGHLYHVPLAASLGRMLSLPVWLQAHGIEAWERPPAFIRSSVERSSLITTVSRYTRNRLLEWANIPPSRVRVLPNTLRPCFTPAPADKATFEKFGLTGSKIILTVSRLSKADAYKGHDRVIEAMPTILKADPRATYAVVGEGDGRAGLEALAARHGLGQTVRFFGRLNDDDVLALYRSADVFIMPSTGEGFGIVFAEAAATALPVVGGNRDGSVDALAEGQIGRLIDPMSQEQIIAAVVDGVGGRLKSNPDAAQRFSFSNFEAHIDALMQDLVRQTPRN